MKSFLDGRSQSANRAGGPGIPSKPPAQAEARASAAGGKSPGQGIGMALQPRAGQGGAHAAHGEPEIECLRQGDRIVSILIKCACGERIELDCVYPEG